MARRNNHKRSFATRVFWIPVGLFFAWIILTLWYIVSFDQSALVLSYGHPRESFTTFTTEKLLKGDTVKGEFIAKENNLGIVALRFQKFERIAYKKEDSLRFRLKEKGAEKWFYENNYRSGFIYDLPVLPIGFPLIADSKDKTYQFELESLKGNRENAMALSNREPIIFSKYQFDKGFIFSSFSNAMDFGFKKFINAFQTIDVLFSSFVFLLPFIFYVVWISPVRDKFIARAVHALQRRGYLPGTSVLKKVIEYSFLTILSLVIAIDVLILQINNDMLYIVISVIWAVLCSEYRIKSYVTLLAGIFCLFIAPVFLSISFVGITEKALAWAFTFFVIGLVQLLHEYKEKK